MPTFHTYQQRITTVILSQRNHIGRLIAGLFVIIFAIALGFNINLSSNSSWSRITCAKFGISCPQTPPFLNITFLLPVVQPIISEGTELADPPVRYLDHPILLVIHDEVKDWNTMKQEFSKVYNIPEDGQAPVYRGSFGVQSTKDGDGELDRYHAGCRPQPDTILYAPGMGAFVLCASPIHTAPQLDYLKDVISRPPAHATPQDKEQTYEIAKVIVTAVMDDVHHMMEQLQLPTAAGASAFHTDCVAYIVKHLIDLQSSLTTRQSTTSLWQHIRCLFNSDYCQRLAADVQFVGSATGSAQVIRKRTEDYNQFVQYIYNGYKFVLESGTAYLTKADKASDQERKQLFGNVVRSYRRVYLGME